MKCIALLGAFVVLFAGILHADEKALKELEGTYTIVSLNKGGTDQADAAKGASVKIDGEKMVITLQDRLYTAKIKIDAAKTPATIDISPSDGKEKGKTFPGIYSLAGSELTLAFVEEGTRPKELKAGGDVTLLKLKKTEKK